MKVRVYVRLKAGVLDVQGKAIEGSLKSVGHDNVSNLRVGKVIEFDLESETKEKAKNEVENLCDKLFTNPVIEDFEITFL